VISELRRSAAHVFVEDVQQPVVDDRDAHHLRVLRVRIGERVTVSDGYGSWRACRLSEGSALEPEGDVVHVPPRSRPLSIAFVPVAASRSDWTVQKLTELGLDRIIVVESARCVVRWDDTKRARNLERFRQVAREASMQSRRVHLPHVLWGGSATELARQEGVGVADPAGSDPIGSVETILVGPEGGWDPEELTAARRCVHLGATVLRADTAALVAATLLVALRPV
jgi:16S rRNA (uracil1498-N3)-methyltransferase